MPTDLDQEGTHEVMPPTLAVGEVLVDELDGTAYRADELIGSGGMGEVYRAVRVADGTACALKCVRSDRIHDPKILLRTRLEAKAFRKIDHPNVVRVLGSGVRADHVPWMAMEWLEGFTIAEVIEQRGALPILWSITILRDLCRGLSAIHEHAIHRDIKPANVHFGVDGITRALDLGAAKSNERQVHLTSTGYQIGTLPFMAPEQLENDTKLDARADLWSATVVLYMLLTGAHPFAFADQLPSNKVALGWRIIQAPHRPLEELLPEAPPALREIVNRGLAKRPIDRPASAAELSRELSTLIEALGGGLGAPLDDLVAELDKLRRPAVSTRPAKPRVSWVPRATQRSSPNPWQESEPITLAEEPSLLPYHRVEASPPAFPNVREIAGRLESTSGRNRAARAGATLSAAVGLVAVTWLVARSRPETLVAKDATNAASTAQATSIVQTTASPRPEPLTEPVATVEIAPPPSVTEPPRARARPSFTSPKPTAPARVPRAPNRVFGD